MRGKAFILAVMVCVNVIVVAVDPAFADDQNALKGPSVQIPSDALTGEVVPVRIFALNPSMEDRIGTIAISVLNDDVEVVNSTEGATAIEPRKNPSQLPIFEKSDSVWIMAPKSQWSTAKYIQVELYEDSWYGQESKELIVYLRFTQPGLKHVLCRATFGKKVGKAHLIDVNIPSDGAIDQMQLPAQELTLTVAPSSPENISKASQSFAEWNGTYNFAESTPSSTDASMIWDYTLTVAGPTAELNVDGFQTQTRYICSCVTEGHQLRVFFDSYGPDNLFEALQKNDLLFVLERTGDNHLITKWGHEEPNLIGNLSPGQHFVVANNQQDVENNDTRPDGEKTPASVDASPPSNPSPIPNAGADMEEPVSVAVETTQAPPGQVNTPVSISETETNEGANMEMLGELLESISMKDLLYFLLFLTLIFSVMTGMFKFIRILADVVILVAGTVAALGCVVASKTMPFGEAVISSILVALVLAVLCTPLLPLSRLFRIRDSAVINQKTEI